MELEVQEIEEHLLDLFPICRSLTGRGNLQTLAVLQEIVPSLNVQEIESGTKVFDWEVPPEWNVNAAYVENRNGSRIIDYDVNNLHLVNYSMPFNGVVSEEELLQHLHTLPLRPEWIPYRTTYYNRDWGFCCQHSKISSPDFRGPFSIVIDTDLNEKGKLVYGEAYKQGETDQEILISTYLCHPSLANDNLAGLLTAAYLFRYITSLETRYSYRLVIAPETIGAICFLSRANVHNIVAGTVVSTTAGPGPWSMKEAFDNSHWVNRITHLLLSEFTNGDYITYPFRPDGSDERQYSSPEFRISTPSIHKSKYYEYDEYHTSADNLAYISAGDLRQTVELYCQWFEAVDSYCLPKRIDGRCEAQLGKRGLLPNFGGTINQTAHLDNVEGVSERLFELRSDLTIRGEHIEAFNWLMHLADGNMSNVRIAETSGLSLRAVNQAIEIFLDQGLISR